MKKIPEIVGQQLKWVQPSAFKMQYELQAGDSTAATLRFRSSFGSFATGESADGCWTFKRVGFWQTRATIRTCGADQERNLYADIATFKNNTWSGGGTLELPDGRKFLATTNFWQTNLEFQDESGGALIQFKSGGLLYCARGKTKVFPKRNAYLECADHGGALVASEVR
ncbi:MAG: hypothetical protein L0229_08860, partial [Blastocatellia bacterium]|nr:hypothetical protein [Blastocatellia bacterium]